MNAKTKCIAEDKQCDENCNAKDEKCDEKCIAEKPCVMNAGC